MNYFELFNLPVDFEIDLADLTRRYRKLLQKYHPDQMAKVEVADVGHQESGQVNNAVKDSPKEQQIDAELINTAYSTLQAPASRAAHYLTIYQQAGNLDQSIADTEFLHNALELREQLDAAEYAVELDSLRLEVFQWIDALAREFKHDIADQDWIEARDTARKLKFMDSVNQDIDSAEDRLEDVNTFDEVDDDLF